MSRRNPLAKWVLPTVIDPPERVCYVVQVPNERQHIAAFLGAIADLASWYSWKEDPAHTAKDVAKVWRDIFDALISRECSMIGGDDVQFRQNGCKLEFSIDCVHWNTLYDPTECIQQIAGQPGGGGTLGPGDCREYDVKLDGNGQWLLPVPVSTGDTVEVTAATGGWYDGATLTWRCPDGFVYILGACGGATTTESGDPINTAPHMSLLLKLLTTTPAYAEALTGIYTVPGGVVNKNLSFQANDDNLADNAGSISFHVKVCNNETPLAWCQTFDLTAASLPTGFHLDFGTHVTGTGIVSAAVGGAQAIVAGLSFTATDLITAEVETCFSTTPTGGGAGSADAIRLSGSVLHWIDLGDVYSGCVNHTWAGALHADEIYMNPSGTGATITITTIKLTGTGTSPFGADNCP